MVSSEPLRSQENLVDQPQRMDEMFSIFDFIKRHRGKIVLGGIAAAGAAYALHQMVANTHESSMLETEVSYNADCLGLQARREYVYETNHRSCDASIIELVPLLKKKLEEHFNVDSLIERLRTGELDSEQRIDLWMRVKVIAFARIIALAYAVSLLMLCLKCQISILASQICSNFKQPSESSWWSKFLPSQLSVKPESTGSSENASVQNVFLQTIQYFINNGLLDLFAQIQDVCKSELENVSLTRLFDANGLNALMLAIKKKLETAQDRHFSHFVIPKSFAQNADSDDGNLSSLLRHLSDMLETNRCYCVLSSLVDLHLNGLIKFISEKAGNESLPMARILPLVADSFYVLSRIDGDSPLQDSLCSPELHQFSVDVFSTAAPARML